MTKYQNRADVSPARVRPDYDPDYNQNMLMPQGRNFVAPDRTPRTVQAYPVVPQLPESIQNAGSMVTGSYQDRARGFAYVTTRLSLATAALAGVGAVALAGVPLLSFWLLLVMVTGYFLTWLVAWCIHSFVSAEGVAWMHTRQGWRYLRTEQKHRHQVEKHINGMDRRNR